MMTMVPTVLPPQPPKRPKRANGRALLPSHTIPIVAFSFVLYIL